MGRKRGRRRALKLKLKRETILSLISFIFIGVGILIIVSFAGNGALLNSVQSYFRSKFGAATLVLPFIFVSAGLMLTQLKLFIAKPNVFLGALLIFLGLLGLFKTGSTGQEIFLNLSALISSIGASIVLVFILLSGLIVMTESSLAEWLMFFVNIFKRRTVTTTADLVKNKDKFSLLPQAKSELKIKGGLSAAEAEAAPAPANSAPDTAIKPAKEEPPHSAIVNKVGGSA